MTMFAAYGASKAALNIFSQVMRLELSMWGVKVAVIQPAGFRTSRSPSSESLQIVSLVIRCKTIAPTGEKTECNDM